MYKTVADAKNGYHQVRLDEESSKLTTFLTEFGRYRYLRSPQGLRSSGDAYTRRFDEILVDIPRKHKVVDDCLLYDASIEDSFFHTFDFLLTCAKNGVTLAEKKFKFCEKEVDFAGYHLGWEKYHPSSDIVSAIHNFPMPDNPTITDIRAWFGLVNQISPFYTSNEVMQPFHDLLKHESKEKNVYWDEHLKSAFVQSKKYLCDQAYKGLTYFDVKRNTCVVTDWSNKGIGFVIFQKKCICNECNPFTCKDGWQLVYCGSRKLTTAERNYAPVEA